ncbi:MAG TPA: class I SAM-dependent methyltransferase [Pyrinomonadaceae bacterium]|nr:class I SAM-dependent methyltransferase [Pyrinomonadaceae bacterium]
MPIPVNGLEQHYGVEPEDYFEHHQLNDKGISASSLLTLAEELTSGKGRLLDIGAGRGELLGAARDVGWDVTGIEPSGRFAEFAAGYSGVRLRSEPVEQCAFPERSFDCVILSAVLEHLYNPDETIKEISRILRPGGAVFIDVPNEGGLYFKVGNLYQKLRGRDWVVNIAPTFSPFHVFGFSPRSLRALLAKHGLRPRLWRVYQGRAMVPSRAGIVGELERLAARAVTAASSIGSFGTYIETWAVKL